MESACDHMALVNKEITLGAETCPQCVASGDSWVNLRQCLICGQIGCCDSSPNTHATKHYEATGHPLLTDALAPLFWVYCYHDDLTVEGEGT